MPEQERSNEEQSLSPAEVEMEQSLRWLVPVRPAPDAADVLRNAIRRADASRHSARRQAWIWRGVAAGLAASLAIMVWMRHEPARTPLAHSITDHEGPAGPVHVVLTPGGGSPADCSYLILRQRVLLQGVEGLPDVPAPPDGSLLLPGEQRVSQHLLGGKEGA